MVRLLRRDVRYDLHLPLRTPRPDLFHPCAKLSVYQHDLRNADRVFECGRAIGLVLLWASAECPLPSEWFHGVPE